MVYTIEISWKENTTLLIYWDKVQNLFDLEFVTPETRFKLVRLKEHDIINLQSYFDLIKK